MRMDHDHDSSGSPLAGLLIAALAAILFAVGAVLQHEAAADSTSSSGLSLARLVRRPRWVFGQTSTMLGTASQVVALAFAPVAVVQPMLAVGLVVALGLRAVRLRQVPLRLALLGAGLSTARPPLFPLAASAQPGH